MYLATVITGCIVPAMNDWNALAKAKMKELKITQEGLAERLGGATRSQGPPPSGLFYAYCNFYYERYCLL